MTMLDSMRRHKNWLKWSLGIVVLTFILLYVPSFLRDPNVGAAATDEIAVVEGRRITVAEYQRAYLQQVNQMRQSYGESLDEQMLKQFGIPQRVVQQLVDEEAVLAEADRLGLTVTDGELRERIIRFPGFLEGGVFIGDARYRQLLRMQRPPLTPAEFEAQLRDRLLSDKLLTAVTDWVRVADAEVAEEHSRRNEKVKLDLAVFKADQFRAGITPTDAEVQAQFTGREESYRIPEKRRVKFMSIDAEAMRTKMTATPQEIEAKYKENISTYSTPEQIRASHILLKTEGKDEAAVKKAAEAVLAKVKAKGDFAALAKQYSEDEGSKVKGGDLDYFGRGAMVKEFEEAAWALQPGQTSDLVKSQFGFHIIKLADKKAAVTRTLDEVRAQLEDQIKWDKAQTEALKLAEEVAKEIDDPSDLDRVSRARALTVSDSGLFARDEPMAGIGFAPAVSSQAFTLEQGKVSGMLRTNQGYAFITLVEVKPAYVPKLDEVKDKVREDVARAKAVELARTKAASMARAAKTNFAAAAKAVGVEVKSTEFITRGSALPEIGTNAAVDTAVFALKAGDTTAPIPTDNAVVVARVAERQDPKPDALATERESLRAELLQQRRAAFFAAYMTKAKKNMKIEYGEAAIKTVLGGM
jgi:peptidyl-prolyl cis-trans isomerase D